MAYASCALHKLAVRSAFNAARYPKGFSMDKLCDRDSIIAMIKRS